MSRSAEKVLDEEYLQIRAKILEVAAFFDRLAHAEGGSADANKLALLRGGCDILVDGDGDKAERLQLLFSRQYEENWRQDFSI